MSSELRSNIEPEWDLIIKPQSKWYSIDLKAVWNYRDLIRLFVRRDFVAQYKQTLLGPVWIVLQPLLATIFFAVIFGAIAKLPTNGLPPALFIMTALVPWTYFADCMNRVGTTFTANSMIFGKVYFPRLVSPVSIIISSLYKFLIQMALLALLLLYYVIIKGVDLHVDYHILLYPLLVLLLAGFGLSIGLIVSSLTTRFRDLTFLMSFIVQFLMYGSSVVIGYQNFGAGLFSILKWNPFIWITEAARYALTGTGTWSWDGLTYSFCLMVVLLVISVVLFTRVEKNFMDTV